MRLAFAPIAAIGLLAASPALAADPLPGKGTPGSGMWWNAELGASIWHADYAGATTSRLGRGGLDGAGLRARVGAYFGLVPGLAVGPSAGFDTAFTEASSELCCGKVERVDTLRLGVETAWWPNPRIGFRVLFGFGLAGSATRADAVGKDTPGVLGARNPSGSYFSIGLARDTRISPRLRIGGALRLEADTLTGVGKDDSTQTMRTLVPSLSLVVLAQ